MEFLEQQARLQYRMLGHEGFYTRVRCQDVMNEKGEEAYVKGEDAVIRWFKERHLRGNLFLGRNPYDEARNVIRISAFSLDIDPVRPKKTASTEEQLRAAITVGQRVLAHYGPGNLCSSGNGALVIFPFVPFVPDDLDLFVQQSKQLEDKIRKQFEVEGVSIDRTYDARRFLKCLGSVSTKGERGMWRNAKFLANPVFPSGRSRILEEIRNIQIEQPGPNPLLNLPAPEDRSAADYALALKLKEAGFDAAHVFAALKEQSHRPGRDDDYKRIVNKLFANVSVSVSAASGGSTVCGPDFGQRDVISECTFSVDSYLRSLDQRGLEGSGILTGLQALDSKLRGLPKGEISTFAARSGYGKTSFAVTVAERLRKDGKRLVYFSTELHKHRVIDKFTSVGAAIPEFEVTSGAFSGESRKKLEGYVREFAGNPVYICDESEPPFALTEKVIRELKPDVFIFDHINRVGESRDVVARYFKSLKNLAKELNMVGIVLAQLNDPPRGKDGKELPSMRQDVREAKDIINESAVFVYWWDPVKPDSSIVPVLAEIAKGRYGGGFETVQLEVDRRYGLFKDVEATIGVGGLGIGTMHSNSGSGSN
jgi:archaellum biogenesis ATPase FlaH